MGLVIIHNGRPVYKMVVPLCIMGPSQETILLKMPVCIMVGAHIYNIMDFMAYSPKFLHFWLPL